MHNPPCDTWVIHLRRSFLDIGDKHISLRSFLDDVLYSWETELLVNDPEFWERYDALTDETRREMDTARVIVSAQL